MIIAVTWIAIFIIRVIIIFRLGSDFVTAYRIQKKIVEANN